ncbi:MAG: DUF3943 domain-containing protein [Chitinophagales bacterium]
MKKELFLILSILLFSSAVYSVSGTLPFHPVFTPHYFGERFIAARTPILDDTLPLPHSNRLLNDDPEYNKKYSILVPILEVPAINGLIWAYDRYIANYDYARISINSVENNFKNGWVWDTDDFPTNYSSHPYAGSLYFAAARSNGYSFLESAPFSLGGSLMWEYFMETSEPSYNDLINTTLSGIFLGEVLYRLSSSVLDDRKTGGARIGREIIGTIIDPVRGINRLLQGKMTRVVDREIYQKETLHLTAAAGVLMRNDGTTLKSTDTSPMLTINFSYGDPFETRYRKPYDYFHLHMDFSFGNPSNIINNVIGEGILFGGNTDSSYKTKTLYGVFQHYDYWNTDSFEIGTVGFGAGLLTKTPLGKNSHWQNQVHLSAVPLGASNAKKVVQDTEALNPAFQNYTFAGGAEMKLESALNLGFAEIGAIYYFYYLGTYVGRPGYNVLSILRPRVSVKLFSILNVGYEYLLYTRNAHYKTGNDFRVQTGEQRIYVLLNFGNF